MTAPVIESLYTHCLTIQLLVDSNDSACWVNGELVALVSTDYRIKYSCIRFAVNILCYDLHTVKTKSELFPVTSNILEYAHFSHK